jgi:hypothetical protein
MSHNLAEKLPTPREELSFKVIEAYCKLLDKHEIGVLNNFELDCAVTTLLNATGWGVSQEVFRTLSGANISKDRSFGKHTLLSDSDGRLVKISVYPDQYLVLIKTDFDHHKRKWGKILKKNFGDELRPTEKSMRVYRKLIKDMLKKGFLEIG